MIIKKNGYVCSRFCQFDRSPFFDGFARLVSSEKIIMQIMHTGEILSYCLLLMGPAGWFFGRLDFALLCIGILYSPAAVTAAAATTTISRRGCRARVPFKERSEVMRDDFANLLRLPTRVVSPRVFRT